MNEDCALKSNYHTKLPYDTVVEQRHTYTHRYSSVLTTQYWSSYHASHHHELERPRLISDFFPVSTNNNTGGDAIDIPSSSPSSSLARGKPNPYLNVVSRLSPSDLIARFTATASPRVQDAVRTTILGLIGGLPQMAFETKTVATGERLASLMFQLQMTG